MSRIYRGEQLEAPKLPVVSRIKVGKMVTGPNGSYPSSLDYFIATGKYKKRFDQVFGVEPNEIPIMFANDDTDFSCNERIEFRSSQDGALWGYSNGKIHHWWNEKVEDYVECKDYNWIQGLVKSGRIKEKITLTLRFIIPAITGIVGVWQLETHAQSSSVNAIRESYDYMLENAGTVTGIPFTLHVKKVNSQKPGGKSKSFPVISMVADISPDNMEKLHGYISQGNSFNGFKRLTNEVIQELPYK